MESNNNNKSSLSALTSLVYATTILIILILLWRAFNLLWIVPKKIEKQLREQGFKGSIYKPFLGDAIELMKLMKDAWAKPIGLSDDTLPRVLPYIHHLLNEHGKNSFGWVATAPWLIVMDTDKIKEMLTRYEDFQKPSHPFTKLIFVGLFGLEGEKWVKHRKIVNPAFHIEKLKNMLPAMYLSCKKMTDLWEEMMMSSEGGSIELDICPYIEKLTSDVISRAGFGSTYDEGRQIIELQREQVLLHANVLQTNYIPGMRFMPTKQNRRVKAICKEIEATLGGIIDKRKAEMQKGGGNKEDLLGIMLESNLREIQEHGDNQGRGLSTEDIVQECKLFYLAGAETTTSLLTWTLMLLSKHQDWQDKARVEILQVFGKDHKPDFNRLNQLKVVSMILNEALRLYTPAYMLMRKVNKDTKLGNWLIPAQTEVVVPLSYLHQDTNIWGNDAHEFNPNRFSEGVSKAMKKGSNGVFMPFSSGPRICIGQNFALLEAKLALTFILRLFILNLSPTYIHAPFAVISVKPQHGVNLILRRL